MQSVGVWSVGCGGEVWQYRGEGCGTVEVRGVGCKGEGCGVRVRGVGVCSEECVYGGVGCEGV